MLVLILKGFLVAFCVFAVIDSLNKKLVSLIVILDKHYIKLKKKSFVNGIITTICF